MKQFFTLSIGLILVFSLISVVHAQSVTYPKEYQNNFMSKLNESQTGSNRPTLIVDPKLCELAEKVANDSEAAYPNKIANTWFSNTEYKKLLSTYSRYESVSLSKLDMLLEYEDMSGGIQPYTEADAEEAFVSSDKNGILLDPKITAGCVGISQGRVKPFMIFVGAENKDTSLMGRVKSLWQVIINKF